MEKQGERSVNDRKKICTRAVHREGCKDLKKRWFKEEEALKSAAGASGPKAFDFL